jgi:hypothetical protein
MYDDAGDPVKRLRDQKETVEALRTRTDDERIERELEEIRTEIDATIKQANDPDRPDPKLTTDIQMIQRDINDIEHEIKVKQGDTQREREIDWDETNQGIGGP